MAEVISGMATFRITEVATRLPAQDLDRARAFYAEKLGLEPVEERPGGLRYRCGNSSFVVFQSTGRATGDHTQMATAEFASRLLRRGVRADALEAITQHRRNGDVLALLSASVDLYVPAIGRSLGFGEIVCTEVRWDGDRLTGTLTTANRRGAEKIFCLAQLRARHPNLPVTAYGNSASDLEHLRLVERPVLVNGSWRTRRAAAREGIACQVWY